MNEYDIYSEPTAWYRRPVVLVGVGGALILTLLIFGLVSLFGSEPLSEEVQEVADQIEEIAKQDCEGEEVPDNCKIDLVFENAKKVGSAELCEVLEHDEDVNSCILAVARTWEHPEYCALINDKEMTEQCESLLYFFLAMEEQDEEYCLKIPNEQNKESCHLRFDGPLSEENCRERLSDTSYCDDLDTIAHAILTSNSHLCYQLNTLGGWAECIDQVGYPDDDEDGLTLADEDYLGTSDLNSDSDGDELDDYNEVKEYITDPLNEDTDGDTYLDGAEVAQGYNPRGEGRL